MGFEISRIDHEIMHLKMDKEPFEDMAKVADIKSKLESYIGKTRLPFVGLSACQIGYLRNAALIKFNGRRTYEVYYNLKILFSFGRQDSKERCMSEPYTYYMVKRPLLGLFTYNDVKGKRRCKFLYGRNMAIACHETDHQNGITIKDKGVKL